MAQTANKRHWVMPSVRYLFLPVVLAAQTVSSEVGMCALVSRDNGLRTVSCGECYFLMHFLPE